MKTTLIAFTLLLVAICASAQSVMLPVGDNVTILKRYTPNKNAVPPIQWTRIGIGHGFMFLSGVATGVHEATLHHYQSGFKDAFPHANDQYWDPAKSWTNKYKDHNPDAGRAFRGSTTYMVWATDGYHLTNMVSNTAMMGGAVTLSLGKKRPWWQMAGELGGGIIAYYAGFYLMYNGVLK